MRGVGSRPEKAPALISYSERLGHAGIVLGLEVSRLAQNSTDWHRLLEISLTDTFILDGDRVYDATTVQRSAPCYILKRTVSEARLHVLRPRYSSRIEAGRRHNEFRNRCPSGFECGARNRSSC